MKGGEFIVLAKAQPSRRLSRGLNLTATDMLAEQRQELLRTAALIALQVADNHQLTCWFAPSQPKIGEGVAVVRQPRELGQQGDTHSHPDELLQGGDLSTAIPDSRLKLLVTKESADLRG